MSEHISSQKQDRTTEGRILVRVQNLKKYFPITKGVIWSKQVGAVKAVNNVSFDIMKGETLGSGWRKWLWKVDYRQSYFKFT